MGPERTGRRPRRGLVVLVVVLVVLAGLVVGGDQLTRTAAQAATATRVQVRLQTPTEPTVEFRGWPFLLQLARARFEAVHITAGSAVLAVGDQQVELGQIDATAFDVVATEQYERVVAGRGEVSVVLPYAGASTLTGLKLRGAGEGRVQVDFELPISGLTVSGTATGRPVLDPAAQQLTFTDVNVRLGNSGDVAIADAVGKVVLAPIPVNQVPYGLRLTAVEARDDGIAVSATGENLPLRVP